MSLDVNIVPPFDIWILYISPYDQYIDLIIQIFMNDNWQDITTELFSLSSNLGFLELIKHQSLTLEETMHAHEINDPKIDPKFDIKEQYTVSKMMENGEIRRPEGLNLREVKNIYAEIIKQQALIMQTYPISQTIYTFTYLYHQDLWKNAVLIEPLVESINTLGSYFYDLNKESNTIKEDDVNSSTFSFRKSVKTNDEVVELFLKAEKQVENQSKQIKDVEMQMNIKELLSHMRIRRSLHLLSKVMAKVYDSKQQSKIQNQLKSLKKRIGQLETLLEKNKLEEIVQKGIFSHNIFKTLRTHFGTRDIKKITTQQALNQLKNGIEQIQLFLLPVPSKMTEYKYKLDVLSDKPINIWSKSYIKYNLFLKDSYMLSTYKTEECLINDIKEWLPLTQELKNDQKFQNLVKLSAPSMTETLYRLSGRNSRWFWESSKSFDDFNVIIHLCNEIDSRFNERKKDIFVSSWFYNWITSLMIRQVLWGFQEDLYESFEYHLIAYQLQYLLHINQKNNNFFHNKLDKTILESFYDNSLGKNKKKKKLISETQRKILSQSLFMKGLHYYFRSFFRLLVILINRKHIVDPFEKEQEIRINNRFRIFKNVLFLKKLTYQTYMREVGQIVEEESKILDEATQLLKLAKNIFNLFPQFQEGQTYYRHREQALILEKLCIKLSMVVITLKLKQPKKFVLKKQCQRYPQIQIN